MAALAQKNIQNAQTLADIAAVVGCSKKQLGYLAFKLPEEAKYKSSLIPKKSGGFRSIHIPRKDLLSVQRKLSVALSEIYYPNGRATAYIKGSNILRNARFHEGKRIVLNIDLEDYFSQVSAARLYGMLRSKPYELSNVAATVLLRLCCFNGSVPQGAPTSPVLANMLSSFLDRLMVEVCRKYGCSYSRYSDDITISTNRRRFPRGIFRHSDDTDKHPSELLGEELLKVFHSADFMINLSKVRILYKYDRQEVTGLTVNEFVNPRRTELRKMRQMLHILEKYGEDDARELYNTLHPSRKLSSYSDSVRGHIEYIKQIRGSGNAMVFRYVERFNQLGFRKIKYSGPEDWHRKITRPVICLENSIDCRQGTAFHIGSGLYLTNNHVVFKDGKFDQNMRMVIFGSSQRLKISVKAEFPEYDLCIIECFDKSLEFLLPIEALKVSEVDEMPIGSEIYLVGFPDWKEDDSVHVDKGTVTASTKKNNISALRLSTKVSFGNSGGPVLNSKGDVVGVALAGADVMDDSEHSYLAVCPKTINTVMKAVDKFA